MLHAGSGRITGVVILVGLSAPNSPTTDDITHAVDPGQRIVDYARKVLGLPEDRIKKLVGHADLVADWTDVLSHADRLAAPADAEIVFNVTGGRVASKLGVMHAFSGHRGQPVSLISVGLSDFVVRRVEFLEDGTVRERSMPVAQRIGLENYMLSYGLEEHSPKARARKQDTYRAAGLALDAAGDILRRGRARDLFGKIMARVDDPDKEKLPVSLHVSSADVQTLRPLIAALGGITIDGREISIDERNALRFLTGGWLEALVLREVESAFAGRDDLDIAATYEPRRRGGKAPETDFDLLVFGNDMLALVECKAITSTRKRFRQALNKLANYRAELAGQGGGAWIVAPLLGEKDCRPMAEQARNAGIRVLHGDDAVVQLVADLGRLFR